MWSHASAILWAQWRTLRNYLPRSNKSSLFVSGLLSAAWYGVFLYLAVIAAYLLSKPQELDAFRRLLPPALLLCTLYWQIVPVLMASMGSALDLRKLLVYPIPPGDLFTLEVFLRISTAIEMFLIVTGAAVGLLMNPQVPLWSPLALGVFVLFNLFCSAGIRDLLVRLLARKHVREAAIFLLVLAAALPQVLLFRGSTRRVRDVFSGVPSAYWPWTAAAHLALGDFSFADLGILAAWTLAAYVFGRWQFHRGLRFDFEAAGAQNTSAGRGASRLGWFYQLPNALLSDPLAALVEKELRVLIRAPRFRLVFLMGFSFGLLIWIPLAFGRASSEVSIISNNYLTFVTVYALLLLSDTLFWNCFGFDRSAVQNYFLVPVKMSTIMVGKNVAGALFVLLEIAAIALVCALLRLPFTLLQILEAFAVACIVTIFLLAVGNLSSVYNPRSVNPAKSLRTGTSGRTQAILMLAFPLSLIPVGFAYLARYAFGTEWAFFGVLLLAAGFGAMIYAYSLGSAVKAVVERKEQVITALSRGEGPVES